MPEKKYRVTLDLPFKMRRDIEAMRSEMRLLTGKRIPKNALYAELLFQQITAIKDEEAKRALAFSVLRSK